MKIIYLKLKQSLYLGGGRSKQDAEKTVLPTVIFINTNHQSFEDLRHRGFVIAIGWWDFSIKVGLIF